MILQASYNELNGIISDKAQIKGLTLSYCDADTTKVTFMLNILGLTPSVSVKLKVISMRDDFKTIYGDGVKKVPFTF